jgi:hypothetical protein
MKPFFFQNNIWQTRQQDCVYNVDQLITWKSLWTDMCYLSHMYVFNMWPQYVLHIWRLILFETTYVLNKFSYSYWYNCPHMCPSESHMWYLHVFTYSPKIVCNISVYMHTFSLHLHIKLISIFFIHVLIFYIWHIE